MATTHFFVFFFIRGILGWKSLLIIDVILFVFLLLLLLVRNFSVLLHDFKKGILVGLLACINKTKALTLWGNLTIPLL